MLSFVDYTMKHYPDEKIFWSNCYYAPMQLVKIGQNKFNIMVKNNSGVSFRDRNNRLKEIYPKVTYFDDFQDLYDKAKPGVCNAVFFGDRSVWIDFIHYLRSVGEWTHIFIDEISEIAPAFTSGRLFKQIGRFSVDAKEIRKCMLNLHCNSQSLPDIDHRVRSKIMVRVFLPGARAGKDSRITQPAIDNLDEDRSLKNWLFTVTRNKVINYLKSRNRKEFCSIKESVLTGIMSEKSDEDLINKVVSELPTRQKKALFLRETEGWSYEEIADELNLSIAACTSLIKRSRENFQKKYLLQFLPKWFAKIGSTINIDDLLRFINPFDPPTNLVQQIESKTKLYFANIVKKWDSVRNQYLNKKE